MPLSLGSSGAPGAAAAPPDATAAVNRYCYIGHRRVKESIPLIDKRRPAQRLNRPSAWSLYGDQHAGGLGYVANQAAEL